VDFLGRAPWSHTRPLHRVLLLQEGMLSYVATTKPDDALTVERLACVAFVGDAGSAVHSTKTEEGHEL